MNQFNFQNLFKEKSSVLLLISSGEHFDHILIHLSNWPLAVDLSNHSKLLKVLDDREGLIVVRLHTLLQRIHVVVGSSLSSVKAAVDANVDWAGEEEDELLVGFPSHLLLPSREVVLVSWESVDKEAIGVFASNHGLQFGAS